MIKAIAIDDEPLGLTIISHFCGNIDFITLEKPLPNRVKPSNI